MLQVLHLSQTFFVSDGASNVSCRIQVIYTISRQSSLVRKQTLHVFSAPVVSQKIMVAAATTE